MFSRLLVPLDGSPVAAQAIPYAVMLARAFDSQVLLLSSIEPTVHWSGMPRAADQEADERAHTLAATYLRSIVDRFRVEGIVASPHVRKGNPREIILAAAADLHCSLIVMTTHGRSGIDRIRIGSVAQHTVRHASIPTLVVRANEQQSSAGQAVISDVTVTLDGSEVAEQALPVATAIVDALHVPLTLFEVLPNSYYAAGGWPGMVYIPTPEDEQDDEQAIVSYLDATAGKLRANGREIHTLWKRSVTNRADFVIANHLSDHPTGLAIMASHGRSGIRRWVMGSTAEALIAQPPCAILIVRAKTDSNRGTSRTDESAPQSAMSVGTD